ncbi:MAG: hypothetical protein IPJ85_06970 [Flavobacteriales bacterium]|nr:hypothetical protein [Flavobacteriales bacterium]
MEQLSATVSIDRREGRMSVAIEAKATPVQRALLALWLLVWIAAGIVVIIARQDLQPGDPTRQFMLAFLAFWAYFLVVVGRAVLWRWKGVELWRVKDGVLTVKDSLLGYGKARTYFAENIQQLGLIKIDRESWKWQWNDSVWVIGGERIGFEHLGRKVILGKGLTDDEAKRLVNALKDALRKERSQAK